MANLNSGSLVSLPTMKVCAKCGKCFDYQEEVCNFDNYTLNSPLPVKRTIDDRYRLEHRLGQGGMGTVFEAIDLQDQHRLPAHDLPHIPYDKRIRSTAEIGNKSGIKLRMFLYISAGF